MNLRWTDWKYACLVAPTFLVLALFLVFKIPHGFEEHVGWYLALLPASIFAAGISQFIGKLVPKEQWLAFRGLVVCFNFLWYFLVMSPLASSKPTALSRAHRRNSQEATIDANSHLSGQRVNRYSQS
jgi:hypothetical protein